MRILHLVHDLPHRSPTGVETYTAELARRQSRAHDVAVVAPQREPAAADERASSDDPFAGTSVRWYPVRTDSGGADFRATYVNARAERHFREVLREFAPEVMHVQHLLGLGAHLPAAARAAGATVVVTLHDYWYLCHRITLTTADGRRCDGPEEDAWPCLSCLPGRSRARRWGKAALRALPFGRPAYRALAALGRRGAGGPPAQLFALANRTAVLRRALQTAAVLIAPSRHLAERYARQGLARAAITVLDYGVDLPRAATGRSPRPTPGGPAGATRDPLVFGCVGRMSRAKGFFTLLAAFQELVGAAAGTAGPPAGPSARLRFLGPPDERDPELGAQLRAIEAGAYAGVSYQPALSHAECLRELAGFDVLVVPSQWEENSPFVILEAFAAGVPVLASAVGGIPEKVIDHRTGWLFAPGDAAALCDHMRRLTAQPAALDALDPAALRNALLSQEEHAERLLDLYRRGRARRGSSP